ncbi:MAG: hypothetical protein ABIJ21_06955 [Nanoarchaeota archaeon]
MRKLLFAFIFLLFIAQVYAAEELDAEPMSVAAPFSDVQVGLFILNLGKFDVATGSFTADFYLSLTCEDECDASGFEFMNGRAASIDKIIDEPNEKFYRIQANLASPVDLRRFPFDKQTMRIILEDKVKTKEDLTYTADLEQSGIDESIAFTGWRIDGWSAKVEEHDYKVYDEVYSQYVFSVNISRITFNSFMKTFLPVFFIVLIMLFSFIMDPDKITTRIAMASSALVGSVMFHISISNQIPPVGYLTFADKFMILTYFVILLSVLVNIIMLEFIEQKKQHLVDKIHKRTEYGMFVVVPLLYVLFFLIFL